MAASVCIFTRSVPRHSGRVLVLTDGISVKSTILRLMLAIVGAVLLVPGIARVAAAIRENFHPFGSGNAFGFSLVLPIHWVALILIGAVACFLSYWLFRKRT